jgi:hypothetical protein
MAARQQVLLLAVLASYAAGQSPQSSEPANRKVSFSISLNVTSCCNSPDELEALKGAIADVVAAKASKPHRNYPVLVDTSTCGSSAVIAAATAYCSHHSSAEVLEYGGELPPPGGSHGSTAAGCPAAELQQL